MQSALRAPLSPLRLSAVTLAMSSESVAIQDFPPSWYQAAMVVAGGGMLAAAGAVAVSAGGLAEGSMASPVAPESVVAVTLKVGLLLPPDSRTAAPMTTPAMTTVKQPQPLMASDRALPSSFGLVRAGGLPGVGWPQLGLFESVTALFPLRLVWDASLAAVRARTPGSCRSVTVGAAVVTVIGGPARPRPGPPGAA